MTYFSLLTLASSPSSSSLTSAPPSTPSTTPSSSRVSSTPLVYLALPSPGSPHISLFISINNCKSSASPVTHGVPQGSMLGPLLFIIYILPLAQITCCHGLYFHCYAANSTSPPRPSPQSPTPLSPPVNRTFSNSTAINLGCNKI